MQNKHLPAAAIAILAILLWRIIHVEMELDELRQLLPLRQSPASRDPAAAEPVPKFESSFEPAVILPDPTDSQSAVRFQPQADSEAPIQAREEIAALKEQIAAIEGTVSEIGNAWNQFANHEGNRKTEAASWSPDQAIGAPDTSTAGDHPTAWASLAPDGGMEWLQADYARPVEAAQVRILESYNPGAVVKLTGITSTGAEVLLWQGNEPQAAAPAQQVFNMPTGVIVSSIRVHLDTRKVPGWNEIDAVELIGRDGSRQWASGASASSTYAQPGRSFGR